MTTILYPENAECNFTGRNGYGKSAGIDVVLIDYGNDSESKILLTPLTSRKVLARCDMTIPISSVPELIAVLQSMVEESDAKSNQ